MSSWFIVINTTEGFQSLSTSIVHFILAIIVLLAIIITILIISYNKRRLMTLKLQDKTREVEEVNKNLEALNRELIEQKDKIAKELADSERLYSIMLESADDGIGFYNNKWELKFSNPALFESVGYTMEEIKGMGEGEFQANILHPDNINYFVKARNSVRDKGMFEAELKLKHKDGHYVDVSMKMVAVKDENGTFLGVFSISRDITAMKETQNQLLVAKEKAEESNRLKSTFLANISHEIRTPLNSIVGFANLLNDTRNSNEIQEEYIGYLNQNTDRLLQIITDIIDLSRLENSELEISYNPVRINAVLDFTESYTTDLISRSSKDIKLTLKKGLPDGKDGIYTDEIWLKRVFRHLMDNAVKFTRSGSITVSSALAGSSLMFTVKDTGIGIAKDHLKSIFEQFRQETDGHQRPFEGLGIGLTMARHVIEQMDGFLWVESEKGKGSEFYFTIPYRPVDGSVKPEKQELIPIEQERSWKKRRILIADDNPDVLRYLHRVLSDTGVQVIQAKTGTEVLKKLQEDKEIDMILMDLQMPEMNGLDATIEIRKTNKDIPIIAQTAYMYETEQDTLIDAGCNACLVKPLKQDQLISVMTDLMPSE